MEARAAVERAAAPAEAAMVVEVREAVKAAVTVVAVTVAGAQGVARGRVRTERAEAEATGLEIPAVAPVTVAEATGRVRTERVEAEATGQAKPVAEAG